MGRLERATCTVHLISAPYQSETRKLKEGVAERLPLL